MTCLEAGGVSERQFRSRVTKVSTLWTPHDRLSGVIRSQTSDAVVLVTGPDGEVRIPRSKIKSLQRSNVSLMPEGFDESLTKTELTDLLAFLQSEKTRPQAARTGF